MRKTMTAWFAVLAAAGLLCSLSIAGEKKGKAKEKAAVEEEAAGADEAGVKEEAAGADEAGVKEEAAGAESAGEAPETITFDKTTKLAPVVFDHKGHGKREGCDACHGGDEPLFAQERGGEGMLMKDLYKGKFCGSCHNGKKAFKSQTCMKCHVKAKK